MKMKSLTIGRLAREAGVNLETVRYYERRGLLPRPPRSASGYRLFPVEAAQRLRFIRRAQELGFSLGEIRELLSPRMWATARSTEVLVGASFWNAWPLRDTSNEATTWSGCPRTS